MIAAKKSLNCEQVSPAKDSETIFCKVKLKGKKPLILGSVYRPPAYNLDQSQKITAEIHSVMTKFKGAFFGLVEILIFRTLVGKTKISLVTNMKNLSMKFF